MVFSGLVVSIVVAGIVAFAGYRTPGFFIAALAVMASIGLQYAGAGEPLRIVLIDGSAIALLVVPACLWAVHQLLRTSDIPRA